MLYNLSLDSIIHLFERFMKIIDADPERERHRDRERQRDTERVVGRGRGNDYCHFSDQYFLCLFCKHPTILFQNKNGIFQHKN